MIPSLLPCAVVSESHLVCFPPAIYVSIEVVTPPPAQMEEWPPSPRPGLGHHVWSARLPSLDVVPIAEVITTNRTVRRGGAFSAIITVTRSVVIITSHNISSSIIIRISIGIVVVNVTVDLR